MKRLLPLLFTLLTITFFSRCDKEEEEEKVETMLKMQARLLKGKWLFKEGITSYFDKDGKPLEARKHYRGSNDSTLFIFDGKIYTIDYDPLYDKPAAKYPYKLIQKEDQQIYLEAEGFIITSGSPYNIRVSVIFDDFNRRMEIHHNDGRVEIWDDQYIRVP